MQIPLPFPSTADFLASTVHWTIKTAREPFHIKYALEMITAFVNKRYSDMEEALAGMMERIWVGDVQDSEKEHEVRRRALLVFLHVSLILRSRR